MIPVSGASRAGPADQRITDAPFEAPGGVMNGLEYIAGLHEVAASTAPASREEIDATRRLSTESGWSLLTVYFDLNSVREGDFHV